MTGIVVQIPEDIRKYKEKIVFGLNVRQLVSAAIALGVCVPLYYYGRGHIDDDLLSWLVIIVAAPLMGIGFFNVNELPLERFVFAVFEHEFLYPQRRRFMADNAFKTIQEMAMKDERPQSLLERIWAKKSGYQASLERTALIMEAVEQGVDVKDFNVDGVELLTVRKKKGGGGWFVKRPKKDGADNGGETNKTKLQDQAEAIEQRRGSDPQYIMTKKEYRTLGRWNKKRLALRKKDLGRRKKAADKVNQDLKKRRKVKTVIPKSTQSSIPFIAVYDEGMFEVTENKYSKMYRIKDVNYISSEYNEREGIMLELCEFYNYFSDNATFQVTVDNRYVSTNEQERRVFCKPTGDENDRHRNEYNGVLRRQIFYGRNDMQMEKYLTITLDSSTPYEALLSFRKMDNEIREHMRRFGSDVLPLSSTERLSYYHDKYRRGHEGELVVDYDFIASQGLSCKDYIAPSYFYFDRKYIQIDEDFYRVMYLTNLPSGIEDEFLCKFCENDFVTTTTISVQPMAQDKALRFVNKRLTGIEMNKLDAERRLVKQGLGAESIRHDIKKAFERGTQLKEAIESKDQRLFFTTVTVMVHGHTIEELERNCSILEGKAGAINAQLKTLYTQQEEALKVTMPFGFAPRNIKVDTTLTTEALVVFMPFKNLELFQTGGFYYGLNSISNNLIVLDRTSMQTPSGFVLGTSGSGKSFATKREILNVLLNSKDTDLIVIDPENEYSNFCKAFGGEVVKISADSHNYISPMDMSEDYGLDEDDDFDMPLAEKANKAWRKKSEFIMSIIERMISMGGDANNTTITPQQKTMVDECVRRCYAEYFSHGFDPGYLPTLIDLQDELDKMKVNQDGTRNEDGCKVAEGVAYYTRGSMSVFANKTNVQVGNRMVVFNVRDLGEQLRQIAFAIVFDFIWNRMVDNKNRGVRTYCYCDEIHVMFRSQSSAEFLRQLYKRGRKYGLCITGLTQNVTDLLGSTYAQGMIENSNFVMMLNQSQNDAKVLSELLRISNAHLPYITNAHRGSGLLFAENVIVPFSDEFPSDSYLYRLMSTKFGDDMSKDEIDRIIKDIMGEPGEKPLGIRPLPGGEVHGGMGGVGGAAAFMT